MSEEQGSSGMERRNAERVDLEVEIRWRHLKGSDAEQLLKKGDYSGLATYADPQESVTEETLERQAYTENLSLTGLKLVGDLRLHDGSSLKKGWELLVEIQSPAETEPVRAVALVMWISPAQGTAPRQAGLHFQAVNKEDVLRVLQHASQKRSRPA